MELKIASYLENLINEFVEIAVEITEDQSNDQFDEDGFGAFIDHAIEKLSEFRTPDTEGSPGSCASDVVDSIKEYIIDFYDIIMDAKAFDTIEFDTIEFDSLMGAFIDELTEFVDYIKS